MHHQELIPHLFRTEYSKLIPVLCNAFGLSNIEIAEDIVSDTFLLAAETWGMKGIPENPTAWLYTVAKNKTKDYLKRNAVFSQKIEIELKKTQPFAHEIEIDFSGQNIIDSQLRMLFAICHPALPTEAQVGLALRILCGFGIEEIGDAFLTNKETINKRLFRAKEKLREEKINIEFPDALELNERLENVLLTLYLLFNEGYCSASANRVLRKDLCVEAMRLAFLLLENIGTNQPQVNALMALMCFHASRFDARVAQSGDFILYGEQDKNLWNLDLIEKGEIYLNQSAQGESISKYHLEAAIAYWHTRKEDNVEKWEKILQLYNSLLQVEYSPIVALNRTYALSKANGNAEAINEALKINLKNNHLYHCLLGTLYTEEDRQKAKEHFEAALNLARTDVDKQLIQRLILKLNRP